MSTKGMIFDVDLKSFNPLSPIEEEEDIKKDGKTEDPPKDKEDEVVPASPYTMPEEIKKSFEKEEVKEEEEEIDNNEEEEGDEDNLSIEDILPSVLSEEGIIEVSQEFINELREEGKSKGDILISILEKGIEERVNKVQESLGDEFKAWKQSKDLGINPDEFVQTENILKELETSDDNRIDTEEGFAEDVYAIYLKNTTSFTPERIQGLIEKDSDIKATAKEVFPELLNFFKNKKKKMIDDANAVKNKLNEERKGYFESIESNHQAYVGKELLPGIKITSKMAEKATKLYTDFNKSTQMNAIQEYRKEFGEGKFDALLGLYVAAGLFDGKNFDAITKGAAKNSKDNLYLLLDSQNKSSGGKAPSTRKNKVSKNLDKFFK